MSNRLTFSLASLIFLIALGLVIAPTSVMAHTDAQRDVNNDGDTADATDIGPHTHVGMNPVDPKDAVGNVGDAGYVPAVPAHNAHPMVQSIMLKPGATVRGNTVAVDSTTNTTFTLVVTFDQDVVDAATSTDTTANADTDLADAELPDATLNVDNTAAAGTTNLAVTRVAGSHDKFEIVVTPGAYPSGTAGMNDRELQLRIQVNADAVYSLQTSEIRAGFVNPVTFVGGGNQASAVEVFTLVKALPGAGTLSGNTPTKKTDGTYDVVFTAGGDSPVTGVEITHGAPTALVGSYTTSAVAEDADEKTYTVTVTPMAASATMSYPAGEIEFKATGMSVGEEVTHTIKFTLPARTYTDSEAPMVNLLSDPDRYAEAFTINFTASDNDAMLTADDITITVTPASAATAGNVMKTAGTDDEWTAMITPAMPAKGEDPLPRQTIRVKVNANDGTNDGANEKEFYLAERAYVAPPDTTPPTLTATVGTPDPTTGAIMVTLAFSEAIQGMPTVTHAAMPAALADTYMVSAVTAAPAPAMNTYMVTVTPNELAIGDANLPAGTVTLTVSAMDAAGNALAAPNTADVPLAARTAPGDTTAPTFTHNAPTTGISAAAVVTLTFSEAVTGVGVTGTPSMDDAQYTTVVAGSGTSHTVTITPTPRAALAEDMGQRIIMFVVSGADAANNKVDGSFSLILAPRKTTPARPPVPGNKTPTFGPAEIAPIIGTVDMPITPVTLPAATDLDGDNLTYSITESLPTGLTFNQSTRYLSGTPTASQAATTYTYVANDGNGGLTPLNFTIEVKAKITPTESGDLAATYADGVTTIASGMIAANGFATVGSADLPDLQEFLELGGTIGLSDGDGAADNNSRTVVISEILWGLDFGAPVAAQKQWQFIELYNTTGAAIDLANWTLTFTTGRPVPASDIDRFSNRAGAGWNLGASHGQSGRVTGTTAIDLASAITPTNIISMYRDIDYAGVKEQVANRGELVKKIPGGDGSGSWKASQRRSAYNRWIYDSKRDEHFKATKVLTASKVDGTPFRINEIGNDTGSANDWIELHNVTDSEQSLKNYQLSRVTARGTDTQLFHFHDQDWKIPAKGFVIISTRHPRDTDLATGKDLSLGEDRDTNAANDRNYAGAKHFFVVKPVNLPDNGRFTLILRNNHESKHLGTGNQLVDVVATRAGSFADANIGTSLWPLTATGLPHGNVIDGTGDEDFRSPRVYQRNKGNGRGEKHLSLRGYTGVGYDRSAANIGANGGTPGYDNGAVKEKIADLSNAQVTFSEIMLETARGRLSLPQWIELYNSSMTQSVNTNGWKLHVENAKDVDTALDAVITLDSMTIPPNQTILIVTSTGRVSDPDHFPNHRVVNLWTTKKHRDALEIPRRTDPVFSTTGLYLKLTDKDNKLVDEIGNLDGSRRTRDEPNWTIPMGADDERRSSLIRVYDHDVAIKGTMEEAWVLADETNLAFVISSTYYGDPNDFGTPGFRAGGPLPVSLSKFRPERLDDGTIVVRWVTESELNNAGFNILRSETKDGEFKQINPKLIAGKGTTSEKNSYEFVDTSAKPNVVYYYQIQDVSLDGDVQTLRTTRLKGHVSPAGKAATTWGELKALQ